MAGDPRASSALCAALADLAEEAKLPGAALARIASAVADLCQGQRAHVERLQRRLRRQDQTVEQLVGLVEVQQRSIGRLEKRFADLHRGGPSEEGDAERSARVASMGNRAVDKSACSRGDAGNANSEGGIIRGRTDGQSDGEDALTGPSTEKNVVEWVFHASYPLSSSNPIDTNASEEVVHPSTERQSGSGYAISDSSPSESCGSRASPSSDILLANGSDGKERTDRRGNDRSGGSSSVTKVDEPSDSVDEPNAKSDESARPVSPVEELRPLPSLDDVLREARRQRRHRRAQKRGRDRDFMTPCDECCAAQREKLTDEKGEVNEKKYARFVVRPGACHHFRHLDESVDSEERDKWHDMTFSETETQSPDEEVEESPSKRKKGDD